MHISHAFVVFDRLFLNVRQFENKQRFVRGDMTIEVAETGKDNLPKEIVCRFDTPLEDKRLWLKFNWKTFSYEPFKLPEVGEGVTIDGPPVISFSNAIHNLFRQ